MCWQLFPVLIFTTCVLSRGKSATASSASSTQKVRVRTRVCVCFAVLAHKDCTEEGTWWVHPGSNRTWSNYTTCIDTEDLEVRHAMPRRMNHFWHATPSLGFAISVASLCKLFSATKTKELWICLGGRNNSTVSLLWR